MTDPIVTRFAPSPTGFLHIGGARTALFNWLYARGAGGKMLLRIEDTDRERSTKEAIDAILDGLKWLELDWDGDVIYQFSRAARHREVAEQLLAAGKAYRCYATPEELTAMREKARAEGRTRLYDGTWRDRDPSEAPAGMKPTIRLKAPQTGETVIEDQVQGRVVWQNENLDDLVLLRGDGTPTYMLAVVVDDHDMGVTHVIRGDDHLINAARQKQIYDALGLGCAEHVAYPADPRLRRLEAVEAPRRARRRRLPRHGISAGSASELPGPARLEPWRSGDLLDRGDDQGVRSARDRPLRRAVRFRQARKPQRPLHPPCRRSIPRDPCSRPCWITFPTARCVKAKLNATTRAQLLQAMPSLKERAKTLIELIEGSYFIFADRPLEIEPKAQALLTPETRELIGRLRAALEAVTPWSARPRKPRCEHFQSEQPQARRSRPAACAWR